MMEREKRKVEPNRDIRRKRKNELG